MVLVLVRVPLASEGNCNRNDAADKFLVAVAAACFVCSQVEDTEAFTNRVQRAMAKTLNLSSMDLLEEAEIPDEVGDP